MVYIFGTLFICIGLFINIQILLLFLKELKCYHLLKLTTAREMRDDENREVLTSPKISSYGDTMCFFALNVSYTFRPKNYMISSQLKFKPNS